MPNFLPDPAKAVRIGNVVLGPLPVKILTSLMAVDDSGLVYSAQSIQSYPIDIFEWRADWFDDKDPHHLRATAYKIKHNAEKPIIFTMRTVREGGMADLDEDAYFSCVNEIAESGLMDAVDVELRRDRAGEIIKNAGEHAEGICLSTFFDEDGVDAAGKDFITGFKGYLKENKKDEVIPAVSALGYDAYNTLIAAIEKAGSTDPAKVQEALKGVSVKGVTGDISFDENGDAKKDMAFIKTVEKGAFKFLETQKVQ